MGDLLSAIATLELASASGPDDPVNNDARARSALAARNETARSHAAGDRSAFTVSLKDHPRKRWPAKPSPRSIGHAGGSALLGLVPDRGRAGRAVADGAIPRHHAVSVVGGDACDGTIRVPMRARSRIAASSIACSRTNSLTLVRTLSALRECSTWLNEGLATALESDDLVWAEERVRVAGGRTPALQSGFPGSMTRSSSRLQPARLPSAGYSRTPAALPSRTFSATWGKESISRRRSSIGSNDRSRTFKHTTLSELGDWVMG